MKYVIAVFMMLTMSTGFAAGFEKVAEENKEFTVETINEAIHEHYENLTLNEQFGVGMGCTLGRMTQHVKDAHSIQVNSERGLVVLSVDYTSNVIHGATRHRMIIEFTPGTQNITKVTVEAISKNGLKRTCSTRDPLIKI